MKGTFIILGALVFTVFVVGFVVLDVQESARRKAASSGSKPEDLRPSLQELSKQIESSSAHTSPKDGTGRAFDSNYTPARRELSEVVPLIVPKASETPAGSFP